MNYNGQVLTHLMMVDIKIPVTTGVLAILVVHGNDITEIYAYEMRDA